MSITTDDSAPGSWAKEIEIRRLQGTLNPSYVHFEGRMVGWARWLADGRQLVAASKDKALLSPMLDVIEAVTSGGVCD